MTHFRVTVRSDLHLDAPALDLPATAEPPGGARHDDVRPADASALCSVAGHLRVAEVVDVLNRVVDLDLDTSLVA